MDARALVIAAAAVLVAGCATPEPVVETVEVPVPVQEIPEPPEELATPYRPEEIPAWISPEADEARVALSEEGAQALRRILRDLITREAAWRAWATGDRDGS